MKSSEFFYGWVTGLLFAMFFTVTGIGDMKIVGVGTGANP